MATQLNWTNKAQRSIRAIIYSHDMDTNCPDIYCGDEPLAGSGSPPSGVITDEPKLTLETDKVLKSSGNLKEAAHNYKT